MTLRLLRALSPVLVLALGAWAAYAISQRKPKAERRPAEATAPVVELLELTPEPARSRVRATGVVTPAQEIQLRPQVTGEVVYVSPALVPGGHVERGQVLARIDRRDYELALEQQRGAVRGAALEVEREQAQQELARHEWNVLGEAGEASPLFSRESQRDAAEARLESGKSGVARARLDLERTVLRAPFDATVVSENVDVGQVVGRESVLADLIGTGDMRVMVSVPLDELALIEVPGVGKASAQGAEATVTQRLARADDIVRSGRVTRLVGRLDERTRRAQIVVSIPDALSTEHGLPLLPGAHVAVEVLGREFDSVYRLPRVALYEGDVAWVESEGRLERRQPSIVWGDQGHVYASAGFSPGERLVVTRLSAPIQGMAVRPLADAEPATATPPEARKPLR